MARLIQTRGMGAFPAVLPRLLAQHPEIRVYALSALCWAGLLTSRDPLNASLFCAGGGDRLAALSFAAGASLARFEWQPALWHWLLMIGAMMLPMTAMAVRHVAFRSFAGRRSRGIAAFLLGYTAVWVAVAPLYALLRLATGIAAPGQVMPVLGTALLIAALWQASQRKQDALRLCHKVVPLAPSGGAADLSCVRFGLLHGRHCLATCWALMLVAMAAGHQTGLMLAVGCVGLAERMGRMTLAAQLAWPMAAAGLLAWSVALSVA